MGAYGIERTIQAQVGIRDQRPRFTPHASSGEISHVGFEAGESSRVGCRFALRAQELGERSEVALAPRPQIFESGASPPRQPALAVRLLGLGVERDRARQLERTLGRLRALEQRRLRGGLVGRRSSGDEDQEQGEQQGYFAYSNLSSSVPSSLSAL